MRGAWVEIIIIGTHTLRAPVPIDSSIDTHQILTAQIITRQKCCAHKENQTEGAMPPGYSSRDDRCGIVRVAAERHVCDGNIGSGLLGRISEAWPALAPPGECS